MFNILTDCGEKYGGPERSNLLNPKETTANRKCCKKHTNHSRGKKKQNGHEAGKNMSKNAKKHM